MHNLKLFNKEHNPILVSDEIKIDILNTNRKKYFKDYYMPHT